MTNQVWSGLGMALISGTTFYGELQNVGEAVETISKIKTTSHNNPNRTHSYKPGWSEVAEIPVELGFYAGTEQAGLRTMKNAGTVSVWHIVAPTSSGPFAYRFLGHISKLGTAVGDMEGNMKLSFSIQPDGDISEITTEVTGVTDIDITDQGTTALTLSPVFGATTYGYKVSTDLADTGVKVTLTYAGSGETAYVNNTSLATATPSDAITLGTAAGSVIMLSVVVYKTDCVPKVTTIEVTHGYF